MSIFTVNILPQSDEYYILIWPSSWHFFTNLGENCLAPLHYTASHLHHLSSQLRSQRAAMTIPVYSPALLLVIELT
jgi:hypothetical protein